MIRIGLDPDLIRLGSFQLSWHGLFAALAVAVGVWLSLRLIRSAGLNTSPFSSLALWSVVGGIVGARLVHIIDYWGFYLRNPWATLNFWEGGLAIWGAIIGGTIAAIIWARASGFALAPYADRAAFGLLMAQAVGRIGDVINGEHFSRVTTLPWGVANTDPDSPAYGRPPSHPAVAYELVMDSVLFAILWKVRRRVRPDGKLFQLYLISYSVGRFLLSFLREDSNTVALRLNQAQRISLIVLAATSALLVWRVLDGKGHATQKA